MIELYTIGFTQKNAERFFGLLKEHGVTLIVDIRLKPDTQLSGFAKKQDLPYFARELAGAGYLHLPQLAPTADILDAYRAGKSKDWAEYERRFGALLDERDFPNRLDRALFERERCCLLCSEHEPDHCHRRIVAERIAAAWPPATVTHLR